MNESNGQKPIENCPKCQRKLIGAIEVSSSIVDGISVVIMEETADRNWILCDFCNQTVCKSCCLMPASGYCDECFIELKMTPNLP
jgi:hypothetical protein